MPAVVAPVSAPVADPRPHRWTLIIRGILAILAAILLLLLPAAGLVAVVLVFAALCAADGVLAIGLGFSHLRRDRRWWVAVLQGLVSLGLAAVALWWPGITLLALVWLAAVWAVWQGVTEILVSRVAAHGGGWLAFVGVLSVLLGLVMFVLPGAGAYGLIGLLAGYAFIRGLSLLAAASRARLPAA